MVGGGASGGRVPGAQPPEELTGLTVTSPPTSSGGLPAIASALRHTLGRMEPSRALQALLEVNQTGGFDCPGCAWPEAHNRPAMEFCENGAKAVADEAMSARIDAAFFARHPIAELAARPDVWLNRAGRLTQPMLREAGADHYTPIGWEDAFTLIAAELRALASPDEAIFYTSGRTSNEAAFLYQLFVRAFGTNNLPDCSNMCHESSGTGLNEAIGVGKGTVTLEDFERADTIFVIGQNPGTNHPRMLGTLQEAARRGCHIVSINPLKEPGLQRFAHPQEVFSVLTPGTRLAERFVRVKVGGDVALLKGVCKALLEEEDRRPGEVLDRGFITEHTDGFEAFAADLRRESWAEIVTGSGVDEAEIRALAALAAASKRLICCWAMGLTQHKHAVANVQMVVNLLLMGGHLGRPGAGACPVRGHSNVQGDRTMGIWERPPEAFLDRLKATFGFEPPRHHGYDTVHAIKAMAEGRVGVFFALGGNFLSATPDTELTARALQRCRLTVQVSTKLNRSHLITGARALILPCLGRTEEDVQAAGPQHVTVENSMGIVHASQGHLRPAAPDLRSEPWIVAHLAEAALGPAFPVPWRDLVEDYDRIRALISQTLPGFEDMSRRSREPGGFLLPNAARVRDFRAVGGRARFTVHAVPDLRLAPDQLLMMTLRSHDQYNTTVYGLNDRYRGIKGERRVVLLPPSALEARGLRAGDEVDLISHFRGEERRAERFVVVPYDLPDGCAATYFPETNVLVPVDSYADRSHTPASKSVVITVHRRPT